jgi:hypothetical protein
MNVARRLVPSSGGGNDCIWTPDALALSIVEHFHIPPDALVLEPCSGGGAFLRAFEVAGLSHVQSCEVSEGIDFFRFTGHVDWIITNPPWSQMRSFLKHAYEVSDNVVFLVIITHVLGLKARLREMVAADFGVKEIFCVETPDNSAWPQSGFQLAAHHLQRGYRGPIAFAPKDASKAARILAEQPRIFDEPIFQAPFQG